MGFSRLGEVGRAGTTRARGLGSVADDLFGALLDEIDYGLIVMSRDAQLTLANAAGQQFLTTGACLRLIDGHIAPAKSASLGKWRRALELAARGGRRMVVFDTDAAIPAIALCGVALDDRGNVERVLAITGRASSCEALSLHNFGREHELTPTEQRVLAALTAEHSPAEIARIHGVSESTVRTQIKSVLAKTQAPTIRHLLLRVTRLPPVRSMAVGGGNDRDIAWN
ncbi:MAG: helix-turn-helix transcriptional regulator [Burkholderiaceae bacterium]